MSNTKKTKPKNIARNDEEKARLRQRILAAAREIALEKGFAHLSIRKLAAAVGYVPGTIYLYFKNRDEIIREICISGFEPLFETMRAAFETAAPRERLSAVLHAYADFALKNPESYRLSFMEDPKFTDEMFRQTPLDHEGGAGFRAYEMIVDAVHEFKKSAGSSNKEDESLLAEVFWMGVHGVVSLKLVCPAFPGHSTEILVDKMIQTLLNGLG